MSANQNMKFNRGAPSAQDCITALYDNNQLFETIAKHPEAGICKRFGKEFAMITAYVESKVHRCGRAVELFLWENARPGREIKDEKTLQEDHEAVMEQLMESVLLHCRVFKASREMAMSSPPMKLFVEKYLANSGTGEPCTRAANGELVSIIDQNQESVPFELTALHNEELERVQQLIVDWLMNPFVDFVGLPLRRLWFRLRNDDLETQETHSSTQVDLDVVNGRTISAVATAFVSMMAILLLAAPIATLNTIEEPKLRLVVMTLFGQTFAWSVQFMGTRSLPMYTLIAAYFQAMVIFVSTTGDQGIRQ